jgi:beta-glucosidase
MAPGEVLTVTVEVTNIGERAGAEVLQLYLSDPEARVPRPEKELKGFQRVFLNPGETQKVTLTLTERDLSFWDPETKGWYAEEGDYKVRIGTSSRHLPQTAGFTFIR